jgi:hypothetical protein
MKTASSKTFDDVLVLKECIVVPAFSPECLKSRVPADNSHVGNVYL